MELCNIENDMKADIGKYLSFCVVTLKTAILIAEGMFDHCVNDCIFSEILERKIVIIEKDAGQIYNEKTVIALIKGVSAVTCIKIWKRFLVQRDMLVQQNRKAFQPVKCLQDLI